jgi:hypothetical protein
VIAIGLSGSVRFRGKPFAGVAPTLAPSDRILIRVHGKAALRAATQIGGPISLSAIRRKELYRWAPRPDRRRSRVSPVKPLMSNRENLSPAAGRADEVNLRGSSCRSLRPGELRLGQSGRWLPPSLDISPGYTCGIGITAGLLAVHIGHRLRQAIL